MPTSTLSHSLLREPQRPAAPMAEATNWSLSEQGVRVAEVTLEPGGTIACGAAPGWITLLAVTEGRCLLDDPIRQLQTPLVAGRAALVSEEADGRLTATEACRLTAVSLATGLLAGRAPELDGTVTADPSPSAWAQLLRIGSNARSIGAVLAQRNEPAFLEAVQQTLAALVSDLLEMPGRRLAGARTA